MLVKNFIEKWQNEIDNNLTKEDYMFYMIDVPNVEYQPPNEYCYNIIFSYDFEK